MIIEVATTSANYDMHDKKRLYARSGVAKHLDVLTFDEQGTGSCCARVSMSG